MDPHFKTPSPEVQPVPSGEVPGGYDSLGAKDDQNWAVIAHISGVLTGFIGPLTVYLLKKDDSAFIANHAKKALNFQLTFCILFFSLMILSLTVVLAIITVPAMILAAIGTLIYSILAAVAVSNGNDFKYPFSLHIIK